MVGIRIQRLVADGSITLGGEMTDYEYARKLFKDCFLAGVWFGQTVKLEKAHKFQAGITATSKMQELVAVLDIDFEEGRIVVKEQEMNNEIKED